MEYAESFDVIVVGGGHAGTEAALAAARMGARVLLLTQNIETLGQMSCNPAIGGIGKGHLVREIDALGGAMGQAADRCSIHFRTLNASKGPAVRATRAQIDRTLYRSTIRETLEHTEKVVLFQQTVDDLILSKGDREVVGVVTQMGLRFYAQAVILTVGTFLGGKIHIGFSNYQGGRAGDPASNTLSQRMREMAFRVERLKTGTPPRIDGRSINFRLLEVQPPERPSPVFSYLGEESEHPEQVNCHITHTNEHTHGIIRRALDRSPLYSGVIEGAGPRYCPSIEDKVVRFAERTSHQIFIEPEGLNTTEIYPNGVSTSLPFDVQLRLVQSIHGFEKAHITRPGYAIEYDYFDPQELRPWLEVRLVSNLFFAGQINGTTGYEEAAAQGIVAGINAGLRVQQRDPWYPRRDQAYIGVLLDDLVTRGTSEPYRMFTSRAEYRLLLREDNADLRLTEIGRDLGVVDDERWRRFEIKRDAIARETVRLESFRVTSKTAAGAQWQRVLQQPLSHDTTAVGLLRRPEISYDDLMNLPGVGPGEPDIQVRSQVEVQAKYHGYIARQTEEIERTRAQESLQFPENMDFNEVRGLSAEACERLNAIRPRNPGSGGSNARGNPRSSVFVVGAFKTVSSRKMALCQLDADANTLRIGLNLCGGWPFVT